MPRLRPNHCEEAAQASSLEGISARCLATHTGLGGFVGLGDKVRLAHPNVAQYPDRFELSGAIPDWIVERIRGN